MEYLLSVVKKRIKRNKAVNLLVFLQVFVGILLLTIAISSVVQVDKTQKELTRREEFNKFEIRVTPDKSGEIQDRIFTEEQEDVLRDAFGDDYSVEIVTNIITFAGKSHFEAGEEIVDRYEIVYSSGVNEIRADKDFVDAIKLANNENTVNYEEIVFGIEDEDIVFKDNSRTPYSINDVGDKDNCHTIYIPMRYYYQYGTVSTFADCKISVLTDNMATAQISQTLNQTERKLYEINPDFSYDLSSNYYDFLKAGSRFEREMQTILLFLIPLMIIVFMGVVSFEALLIEKRRFAISVCVTMGAGNRQIVKEIALELALLTVFPTLLAFVLSDTIMLSRPAFMEIEICYHSAATVLALLSTVLVVNICGVLIAYKKTRSKNLTGAIYEEY